MSFPDEKDEEKKEKVLMSFPNLNVTVIIILMSLCKKDKKRKIYNEFSISQCHRHNCECQKKKGKRR